jgi:uncharacterized protein (DUF2252 family)
MARAGLLRLARDLKMARSAHAYVRGSTTQFYAWLVASKAVQGAPKGPALWICGDCHVGNLGPVAGAHGGVDIQIRDLDQTVIGDPAHDLIRLGLSLATAARSSDLPGVVTADILEAMVEGYSLGLAQGDDGDAAASDEPEAVRTVRRDSHLRGWKHLARDRMKHTAPRLPLGPRFWSLQSDERAELEALVAQPEMRRLVLAVSGRDGGSAVRMADAAFWKKGCSSLGLLRFAVLAEIEEPSGALSYGLLDIKEAVKSVAPVAAGAQMPKDNAERVVAGARALSPNLGDRMLPEHVHGKAVFVRELMPQDLKIDVEQFSREEAPRAARYLAEVVGRGHGRQLSESDRKAWIKTLQQRRTGGLDAPNWLWTAVVDLAGVNEAGYLEHCRKYALEAA